MRSYVTAPLLALFALTACGDDQAAKAPAKPEPPATSEAAKGSPPAAPPSTTVSRAPESEVSAGQGAPGSKTVAPAQTANAPALNIKEYQDRTYTSGPVSLQLKNDNSFVMGETGGSRKVEGRYAFGEGMVTFSDPTGDVGPAQFPMRCRFEPGAVAGEFRLADADGSCARFKDLTFRTSAG